jgi:acyl-CoA synthetase (AMP-forming)/AMP-acid ligase II
MALGERVDGRSVGQLLEERAEEYPDRVFLHFGDRRFTYAQVNQRASALAAALHELGVERGDRIALDLPNWPEFILSMFAAAKIGAVMVQLNPLYTVPELQFMLRQS